MSEMDFPFLCDKKKLREFVTRWLALDQEEGRLREEKRFLEATYSEIPLACDAPVRAVLCAIKVVKAKSKLEKHKKEPCSPAYQAMLEHEVAERLDEIERQDRLAAAIAKGEYWRATLYTPSSPVFEGT